MEQVDTIKAERDTLEKDLKVQQDDMGECYLQLKFSYALKYCEWNSPQFLTWNP